MPCKKPLFRISGFVAGVLLFIALLAVQLNSVLFNSGFQKAAIDRLDVYDRLIASTSQALPNNVNTTFEAAVKSSITPDLFNKNVKSLIDGLIGFVSGMTSNLPDLYIAGSDKLSIAASAGVTPAAVEKINLQLVMMFSNDQNYSDILSVISLIQFSLSYLPAFSLLLYTALIAVILLRSSADLIAWLRATASSYFVVCWFAASLFALAPYLFPPAGIPDPVLAGLLADYIRYCSVSVSAGILLSGIIVLAGEELTLYLHRQLYKLPGKDIHSPYPSGVSSFSLELPVKSITSSMPENAAKIRPIPHSKRMLPAMLSIMVIYSLLTYSIVNSSYDIYNKRSLGHAVSYIMGSIGYNRYTDARNDDVCLLQVKVLNGNDKMPVQELQAEVYPIGSKDEGRIDENKAAVPVKTDENGAASFLLSEGDFRIVLNSAGVSNLKDASDAASSATIASIAAASAISEAADALTYDFSLATPGRTDLTITLGADNGDAGRQNETGYPGVPRLKIAETSMQYIP